MKKSTIIFMLFCAVSFNSFYAQTKSQAIPIQFQTKSVNAFTIELNQSLDFVTELFNSKFEIPPYANLQKNEMDFIVFNQIKYSKISTSFLDLYYKIVENKTDNTSLISITLLVSKGYDNFIDFENDAIASQNILNILNELSTSVERKNMEVAISKKEKELQLEKEKLLLLEEEYLAIENERKVLENKSTLKLNVLKLHSLTTQESGNQLEKLKKTLSDFEKNTGNKTKSTLRSISMR